MKVCHIQLTDKHLVKLAKGSGIFITKEMMCGKDAPVHMAESKLRKMMKNHSKGMKYTLKLSPEELMHNGVEMEGSGINWKKLGRTVWSGIKKAAKESAKIYREKVRPHISEGLKNIVSKGIEDLGVAGVDTALSLVGAPELAAIAQDKIRKGVKKYVSEPATEAIRKTTGAYGMKKKMKKPSLKQEIHNMEYPQQPHPVYKLKTDESQLLSYNHPAMSPAYPLPDNSFILVGGQGLFLSGRGLYMGGGAIYPYGSPLNPAHLQLNSQAWSYS